MSDYYAQLTNTGVAKIANAHISGTQVKITQMAFGDGASAPDKAATALQNEVHRTDINQLAVSANDANVVEVDAHIPPEIGGFTVREIGLFDAAGDLVAIAKSPETYKPTLASGAASDLTFRTLIKVSQADSISLAIDPAIAMASRLWVEAELDVLRLRLATAQMMAAFGILDDFGDALDPRWAQINARLDQLEARARVAITTNPAEDPVVRPTPPAPTPGPWQIRPNIYVDQINGNDANSGYAALSAKKTLAAALAGSTSAEEQPIVIMGRYRLAAVEAIPNALGRVKFIPANGAYDYPGSIWSDGHNHVFGALQFASIKELDLGALFLFISPTHAGYVSTGKSMFEFTTGFEKVFINNTSFSVSGTGDTGDGVFIGGTLAGHIEFNQFTLVTPVTHGRVIAGVAAGGDPNVLPNLTSNITQLGDAP